MVEIEIDMIFFFYWVYIDGFYGFWYLLECCVFFIIFDFICVVSINFLRINDEI